MLSSALRRMTYNDPCGCVCVCECATPPLLPSSFQESDPFMGDIMPFFSEQEGYLFSTFCPKFFVLNLVRKGYKKLFRPFFFLLGWEIGRFFFFGGGRGQLATVKRWGLGNEYTSECDLPFLKKRVWPTSPPPRPCPTSRCCRVPAASC